jgi:hypothetical protein
MAGVPPPSPGYLSNCLIRSALEGEVIAYTTSDPIAGASVWENTNAGNLNVKVHTSGAGPFVSGDGQIATPLLFHWPFTSDGQIIYGKASDNTSTNLLNIGTSGQVMVVDSTPRPKWVNSTTLDTVVKTSGQGPFVSGNGSTATPLLFDWPFSEIGQMLYSVLDGGSGDFVPALLNIGGATQYLGVSPDADAIPQWKNFPDLHQYYTYVYPDQASKSQSVTPNTWFVADIENAAAPIIPPPYGNGIYDFATDKMTIPHAGVWQFSFGGNWTVTAEPPLMSNYCTIAITLNGFTNGIYAVNGGTGIAVSQCIFSSQVDTYMCVTSPPIQLALGDEVRACMYQFTPGVNEVWTTAYFSAWPLELNGL